MSRRTIALAAILILATGGVVASQARTAKVPYPSIVFRFKRTGLTKPIKAIKLFTPKQDGLYRISLFWDTTVPLNNGSFWCAQLNWTDGGGQQFNSSELQTYSNNQGTNNYSLWVSAIQANAGTPVNFTVLASGSSPTCDPQAPSPDGSKFDLFFTMEQLE